FLFVEGGYSSVEYCAAQHTGLLRKQDAGHAHDWISYAFCIALHVPSVTPHSVNKALPGRICPVLLRRNLQLVGHGTGKWRRQAALRAAWCDRRRSCCCYSEAMHTKT